VPVTVDEMVHHTKAVVLGTQRTHVVVDMPFMSYQAEVEEAVRNAGHMLKEGGAQSVKLEGGRHVAETVRRMVQFGIPVMGHIGLTPQSINAVGGYRVQGRARQEAVKLVQDAKALEEAGAYAVVLELVPAPLAGLISRRLSIPTIGIGAGPECDGQVQVQHDMLGLFTDFVPSHAKQYVRLAEIIKEAFSQYANEVKEGSFPTNRESFTMDESLLDELASLP
jgi:3-methyl-2-oxobutanoate hydroxymethyltransferase